MKKYIVIILLMISNLSLGQSKDSLNKTSQNEISNLQSTDSLLNIFIERMLIDKENYITLLELGECRCMDTYYQMNKKSFNSNYFQNSYREYYNFQNPVANFINKDTLLHTIDFIIKNKYENYILELKNKNEKFKLNENSIHFFCSNLFDNSNEKNEEFYQLLKTKNSYYNFIKKDVRWINMYLDNKE